MTTQPTPQSCCEPTTSPDPIARAPDGDTELALFAKALAHPVRIHILRLLAKKAARQCSHIVDELPLAQSTVSEHLRILRSAGLIRANNARPRVAYCIEPDALARLKTLVRDL